MTLSRAYTFLAEASAVAAARSRRVENIHEERACPRCKAPVGERCRRMVGGVGLRERHNKHPHRERVPEGLLR